MRTNNVNLNIAIQEVDAKISEARVVNESLSIDIQELATYDNIAEVAKEAGLTNQQNNVVSIRIQP